MLYQSSWHLISERIYSNVYEHICPRLRLRGAAMTSRCPKNLNSVIMELWNEFWNFSWGIFFANSFCDLFFARDYEEYLSLKANHCLKNSGKIWVDVEQASHWRHVTHKGPASRKPRSMTLSVTVTSDLNTNRRHLHSFILVIYSRHPNASHLSCVLQVECKRKIWRHCCVTRMPNLRHSDFMSWTLCSRKSYDLLKSNQRLV